MWSIGVIAYVMMAGFPPFEGDNDDEIFSSIVALAYSFPSPEWDNYSHEAKDFIRKLMTDDAAGRLTATQALDHPFITKYNSEDNRVIRAIPSSKIQFPGLNDSSLSLEKYNSVNLTDTSTIPPLIDTTIPPTPTFTTSTPTTLSPSASFKNASLSPRTAGAVGSMKSKNFRLESGREENFELEDLSGNSDTIKHRASVSLHVDPQDLLFLQRDINPKDNLAKSWLMRGLEIISLLVQGKSSRYDLVISELSQLHVIVSTMSEEGKDRTEFETVVVLQIWKRLNILRSVLVNNREKKSKRLRLELSQM
eukprot:TRINITY_DN3224_c1_g3_i1.p1 TRINITY_DN3224_c1_g3~~TRINITY_DN3224_c1_g3_i1.p1  ORF type:complete len:308 (-),score=52.11 TRINITY_DN3224_c1_g3_i1:17-940(-)